MALPAYMTITGTTQGAITKGAFSKDSVGNIGQDAHLDEILVQGFSHEVIIPRDPQSGQPTGQRIHKPLCVTKIFDKSSPLLFGALTTGEVLSQVQIKWWRQGVSSGQDQYFTITLTDAIIVNIKSYMHNLQDLDKSNYTHLEDVQFSYKKIIWDHMMAGTTAQDNWGAPVEN